MNYEEYKALNDKMEMQMKQSLYAHSILHIDAVDLKTEKCKLSNGKTVLIADLVTATEQGKGCVSNPSAIRGWKNFVKVEPNHLIPDLEKHPLNNVSDVTDLLEKIFSLNITIEKDIDGVLLTIQDKEGFLTGEQCTTYLRMQMVTKANNIKEFYVSEDVALSEGDFVPLNGGQTKLLYDFIDETASLLEKENDLICSYDRFHHYIWIDKYTKKEVYSI
jgi:hypothetical protein